MKRVSPYLVHILCNNLFGHFDDYDQKWCGLNDTRTWHMIYCQDPFLMQIHNIKSEFQYSIRVTCYKVVCAKIYNKRLIIS